jgi:NADH-quinone oxidoreductase subunit J
MGSFIAFWILATVIVGAALMVVLSRNIFRSALFLVLCFFTIAGIYVILSADFLAAAQVLIYVGAIGVLLIFGIMLSRDIRWGGETTRWRGPAFLIGGLLLAIIIVVIFNTAWPVGKDGPTEATTSALATQLFSLDEGFVLPFEIASLVLLAALIGAISLVRDK